MTSLSRKQLLELAEKCAQETTEFFQSRENACASCLYLFKQAILHRDEGAWEVIYHQYTPLVKSWVIRHPAFSRTGEDADFFVNMAFSRMWQAITPEKCADFNEIKSVLRYLQVCAHSAILDSLRHRQVEWLDIESREVQHQADTHENRFSIEEQVQHRIYCKQAFDEIEKRMRTPQEQILLHAMFVLGMKPSEIMQHYPEEFQNVQEIYRTKENLMARLRRDKELRKYLG